MCFHYDLKVMINHSELPVSLIKPPPSSACKQKWKKKKKEEEAAHTSCNDNAIKEINFTATAE